MNIKRNRNFSFSIQYVRQDGSIGQKDSVVKTFIASENALYNRTVSFYNYEDGKNFKILLDHWTHYNGIKIDHEK